MLKKNHILFLLIILTFSVGCGQSNSLLNPEKKIYKDSIDFIQLKTHSLYNSNQIISLITLRKTYLTDLVLNSFMAIWISGQQVFWGKVIIDKNNH